jgi:hypothetical protein
LALLKSLGICALKKKFKSCARKEFRSSGVAEFRKRF